MTLSRLVVASTFVMTLLVFPSRVTSQSQSYWKQIPGLYGGAVYALALDSQGSLLAGCDADYRSEHWARGVLRTSDDGKTWERIGLSDRAIALLYQGSNGYLFASSGYYPGLFRSGNQGYTWDTVGIGLSGVQVLWLTYSPWGSLYAGTGISGIYESTDDGVRWMARSSGFTGVHAGEILAKPGGRLWAASDSGVFSSTDSGHSWEKNQNALTGQYVWSLAADSQENLYAAALWCYVYKSSDHGASWVQLNAGSRTPTIRRLSVLPSGEMFAATVGGLYSSSDNGVSWKRADIGDTFPYIEDAYSLLVRPDGHVFIGTQYGIHESRDSLASWSKIGIPNSVIKTLGAHPSGTVFAVTDEGLSQSSDKGESWVLDTSSRQDYLRDLFVQQDGVIYAIGQNLLRSTDAGKSFRRIDSSLGYAELSGAFAVAPNGNLYVGTSTIISDPPTNDNGGVYRSTDSGMSWTLVTDRFSVQALAIDSLGHIMASIWYGPLMSSTDGGDTWIPYNNVVGSVQSIEVSPQNTIVLGTRGSGVIISTNDGETWVQSDLNTRAVNNLAVNRSSHIFAGTDSGVYMSTNGGVNWTHLSSGLPNAEISALAVDVAGYVYAGTPGGGLFRSVNSTLDVRRDEGGLVPSSFSLSENYPNPFNASTTIRYQLPSDSRVSLDIYNVLGQVVASLVKQRELAGYRSVNWNASNCASGVYFYRLDATGVANPSKTFTQVRKMLLMK